MIGMLFIFILIIVFFVFQMAVRSETIEAYSQQAIKQRTKILQEIKQRLDQDGVQVQIDEVHGIIRLPEGVLFASGEPNLTSSKAKNAAHSLAKAFKAVLPCYVFSVQNTPFLSDPSCQGSRKVYIEAVLIEGHTDDDPIRTGGLKDDPKIDTNVKLSARRAANTYHFLMNSEPALKDFLSPQLVQSSNIKSGSLFAVSAYGPSRPLSDIDDSLNRRIDIRLIMFMPNTSEELSKLRKLIAKSRRD